jgi:hypothetical protein
MAGPPNSRAIPTPTCEASLSLRVQTGRRAGDDPGPTHGTSPRKSSGDQGRRDRSRRASSCSGAAWYRTADSEPVPSWPLLARLLGWHRHRCIEGNVPSSFDWQGHAARMCQVGQIPHINGLLRPIGRAYGAVAKSCVYMSLWLFTSVVCSRVAVVKAMWRPSLLSEGLVPPVSWPPRS